MTRTLLAIWIGLPLWAGQVAVEATPTKKNREQAAQPAETPSPVTEQKVKAQVDVGYRGIPNIGGNFDTYRSIVNYGEGPKLFGAEMNVEDAKNPAVNRFTASGHGWGGEPWTSFRADAEKFRSYRFMADYRNLAYFNYLPSFANPFISQGIYRSQRAFDTRMKNADVSLELWPSRRVTPYFGYQSNYWNGHGVTPYVTSGNEFPVQTQIRNQTNNYRGGVQLELTRMHVTLEQGGTTFKDDQRVFTREPNTGNRPGPILGRQTTLNDLEQAYGVRGDGLYSKGMVTASPFSWLNVYGQFLFSQPEIDVRYSENARGLILMGGDSFYTGLDGIVSGLSRQPHTTGSATAEIRPTGRLRILESWTTDRFHNAASALLLDQLLVAGATRPITREQQFNTRLNLNYNRQQLDVLFDITSRFTVRGGHRYVWGNALTPGLGLSPTGSPSQGELKMHVGLAGVTLRPTSRALISVDYEGSPGDRNYFRTSLQNYHMMRARGRVEVTGSFHLYSHFRWLDNQNPAKGIDYKFQDIAATGGLQWMPAGGRRASIIAEYGWSSLKSDILFLVPSTLQPAPSYYRDRGHMGTLLAQISGPKLTLADMRFELCGSLFQSGGSRPTKYYQPMFRTYLPVAKTVELFGEWRYYGFSQAFYLQEAFRSNQLTAGLRFKI